MCMSPSPGYPPVVLQNVELAATCVVPGDLLGGEALCDHVLWGANGSKKYVNAVLTMCVCAMRVQL